MAAHQESESQVQYDPPFPGRLSGGSAMYLGRNISLLTSSSLTSMVFVFMALTAYHPTAVRFAKRGIVWAVFHGLFCLGLCWVAHQFEDEFERQKNVERQWDWGVRGDTLGGSGVLSLAVGCILMPFYLILRSALRFF
jgi:hypothetical protein